MLLKKFIVRLFITILFISTIFTIIDKVLYYNTTSFQWKDENLLINRMNSDKLKNSNWDDNPIWKFKDDGPLPSKGNKKRILVVGDSFIWGHGYSNLNYIWWKQLERILYLNGYTDVEVVAAGMSGFNTDMELNKILKDKEVMAELNPDLIIIGYVENDPESRDSKGKAVPKMIEDDIFEDTNNVFIKFFRGVWPNLYSKIIQQIVSKYKTNSSFIEKYGFQYNIWSYELTFDPWKGMYERNVLLKLSEYINNELNCPLFVVPLISFPGKTSQEDFIIEELNKFGIPNYSLSSDFVEKYPNAKYTTDEWGINPANGHPAIKTSLFYAEWTYDFLRLNYPEIIGDKHDNVEFDLEINDWLPYSLKPQKLGDNYYKISYPSKNSVDSFLTKPINKKYIKLNFKFPIKLKSIEISGDNIKNIEIYTSSINSDLGYDDQSLNSIGKKSNNFVWNLDGTQEISSININANISGGKSSDLYIKFNY